VNVQRAADAVEARRGELRMTQRELADAAGVDIKTIGSLEKRGRWPIARTRAAIERALKWPPGEMKRIADQEPAPPALSEATQRMMREELGDEVASALIAHAEHLASGRSEEARDDPPSGSGGTGRRFAG
jgi:transcriptional regulator with XRE-family HTH domain